MPRDENGVFYHEFTFVQDQQNGVSFTAARYDQRFDDILAALNDTQWLQGAPGAQGAPGPQGPPGPAGDGTGDMVGSNNLLDLTNISLARYNLGAAAADHDHSSADVDGLPDFIAETNQHIAGINNSIANNLLTKADNLASVADAATARANIGAAAADHTHPPQTFNGLLPENNLSELTDTAAAVTNLGLSDYSALQASVTQNTANITQNASDIAQNVTAIAGKYGAGQNPSFGNLVNVAGDDPKIFLKDDTDRGVAILNQNDSLAFARLNSAQTWWELIPGETRFPFALDLVNGDITLQGDISVNAINLRQKLAPLSFGDLGTEGDIKWDQGGLYVCIADNQWKQIPLLGQNGDYIPPGHVIITFDSIVPTNYVELNGAIIVNGVSTYPNVAARYTYMRQGNNLALPDMRGRVPRGWAHGSGTDPGRSTRLARSGDGASGDFVGTYQEDEIKAHTHTQTVPGAAQSNRGGGDQDSVNSSTSGNSGSTGGLETRMKNIAVMFCMKMG